MKHAFLIIAHNEFQVLNELLQALDDHRNDIYLHIDKKVDISTMNLYQMVSSRLVLINKRIRGYWGSDNLMKIEYMLLTEAYKNGPYDYYHLLSGVDYPTKTIDEIDSFFDENRGCEFFEMCDVSKEELSFKYKYYHLLRYRKGYQDWRGKVDYIIGVTLSLIGFSRKSDVEIAKASQWFSITHDCAGYLLSRREENLKRFAWSLCSDEFFAATSIRGTDFEGRLYCNSKGQRSNVRDIDWIRGYPYVYTIDDVPDLLQSKNLFARKFAEKHIDAIAKIKDELIKKKHA